MSDPIDRRQFLGRVAALGGGAVLLGSSAPLLGAALGATPAQAATLPPEAITAARQLGFQLSWLKDEQFVGEYQALSNGYWTKQGLNVTLLAGGPSVAQLSIVQAGHAMVTLDAPDAIAQANQHGAGLKIIGTKFQKSPYALVSLAAKPIATPQAVTGKTIGVGSASLTVWNTFLSLNKIPATSVTTVPFGYDDTPLAAGKVDGILGYITDDPISLASQGVETKTLLFYDYGYKMLANCYAVTAATLRDPAKYAALAEFMRGEVRGWQDAVAHPQAATSLAVNVYAKDQKLDPTSALATVKAGNALIAARGAGTARGLLTLDKAGMAGSIATIKAGGGTMSADTFVPSFLQKVFGGKTTL